MKNIFIVILLLLNLISCKLNECQKVYLTDKDKEWLKAYEYTDTILFISNLNNIDSFIVSSIYEEMPRCITFETDPYSYECAGVELLKINKISHEDKESMIDFHLLKNSMNRDSQSSEKVISFDDFNVSFSDDFNNHLTSIFLKSQNKNYETIYIKFKKDKKSSNIPFEKKVSDIHWSKKSGLIRYCLFSGEIFEFWKIK